MRPHIGAANANTSNRVQIGAREEIFSVVKYIVDPSRISSGFFLCACDIEKKEHEMNVFCLEKLRILFDKQD